VALDLQNYAFSFSHAIVRVNDRQFIGVRSVNISQDLTESVIYGTDSRPLKRTVGQLQIGRGNLAFSDYQEGTDFFKSLGLSPFTSLFTLDYTLQREDGTTRSIECQSCRLLSFGVEHENGADGLEIQYGFSFMAMKVDGIDFVLSPKALLQAGLSIAQNLVNLL
jgi:hypothetical protein